MLTNDKKLITVAARMAELGHPSRLAIFKFLVKSGNTGSPVGDIQQELDIPGSTLSHHISKMVNVGLIKQIRESRTLYCFANFEALQEAINYLQEECCLNEC